MISSFCAKDACVDVEFDGDQVYVRSTRAPERVLVVDREEWDAFTKGVRAGEFDVPVINP